MVSNQKNFPDDRNPLIRALNAGIQIGEKVFTKVQATLTEIKSRDVFFKTLTPAGLKFVAAGAEKIVLLRNRIPPSNLNEPAKAYYIPVSNFFISKGNALRNEKRKMDEMKSKIGDINHLLLDAKELKGKDRIQGHYTLEVDAATGGSFEKAIRDPETNFETRAKLGGDFLKGLSQLHKANYAYGDLKPENCLIFHDKKGNPLLKIADFGKADKVNQGETKIHQGNLRFSAPEAKFSKENDVWGAAIILIRNLEESVLPKSGEPLVNVDDQDEVHAMKERRGIEKFIVNHKAFIGIDESRFADKVGRRIPRVLNPQKYPAKTQSNLISDYVDALAKNLVTQDKMSPEDVKELASLLKSMTKANPGERLALQEASEAYNRIFNLS